MTLIVGVNLGDAVGVIGDTRVAFKYPAGRTVYYDDCQKVYELRSLIVGVAGDVRASARLMQNFYQSHLNGLSMDEELQKAGDIGWLKSRLMGTYEVAISKGLIQAGSRFALILASENFLKGPIPPPQSTILPFAGESSFTSLADALTRRDPQAEQRLLLASISFPGGAVRLAGAGEALRVGSGSHIDTILAERVIYLSASLSGREVGFRLVPFISNFVRFHDSPFERNTFPRDSTFNGICYGLGYERGKREATGGPFRTWPADGVSEESYKWEAMPAETRSDFWNKQFDVLGDRGSRYLVRFDAPTLGVWIRDHVKNRRLRLRTIFEIGLEIGPDTAAEAEQIY